MTPRGDSSTEEIRTRVAVAVALLLCLWSFLVVANLPVSLTVDGTPVTVDPSASTWGGTPALLVATGGLLATLGLLAGRFWGYVGTIVAGVFGVTLAFGAITTHGYPDSPFWTAALVALLVCTPYLVISREHLLVERVETGESR